VGGQPKTPIVSSIVYGGDRGVVKEGVKTYPIVAPMSEGIVFGEAEKRPFMSDSHFFHLPSRLFFSPELRSK
jgi:hypothetical protein